MRLTDEEKIFIRKNAIGKSTKELVDLLNKKFNKNYSEYKIYRYKKRNGIKSGINTKFKKGHKPSNYKPVGSEFVSKEGYTYIKVAEPNSWKRKTTAIYEKQYGSIPIGYCVIFLDQNKSNFDLDNLMLIRNKDKLTAKNKHLLFKNKELTKTGLLIAKLINTTYENKNRR